MDLEGIYTDKFTYEVGEPIRVHAALQTDGLTPVTLKRLGENYQGTDPVPNGRIVSQVTALIPYWGLPLSQNPGVYGAGYYEVCSIPTAGLKPGLYRVELPLGAFQPEHLENIWNTFNTPNWCCYVAIQHPEDAPDRPRILWIHDSMTSICYDCYGEYSIYPADGGRTVDTVSYQRPGISRLLEWDTGLIQFIETSEPDLVMDFMDLLALDQKPLGYLNDKYDLVVCVGQFEYLSHPMMAQLKSFLDSGGNAIFTASEFAAFRVRIDSQSKTLTTFKWDWALDPEFQAGSALTEAVAGIGMCNPTSILESELLGQQMWNAMSNPLQDMQIHNWSEASWIFEGTGLGADGILPAAVGQFATGNHLTFEPEPRIISPGGVDQRIPENTLVWASAPSNEAVDWWNADGNTDPASFSRVKEPSAGFATATWQRRPSGGQVITYANQLMSSHGVDREPYRTIFRNVLRRLGSGR